MDKLSIPRKIVKGVALAVGLVGTIIGLMAVVGVATDSVWVRAPVALVVAVALPALIADRLLPEEPTESTKGLTSDVFALCWMVVTVGLVAAGGLTRPLLVAEGDRLARADLGLVASAAYLLAGVDSEGTTEPAPASSASASVSASTDAVTSASAAPPPAVTASASVTASATASAVSPQDQPEDGEGDALSPTELFKKWAPSVVTVNVKGPRGDGGGTGFLVDDRGTIATNHHVIADAKEGSVKFMSGAIYDEVWVLVQDPDADLALLRIDLTQPKDGEPPSVEPVQLADSDEVEVGEAAISIGNPLGLEHTLTTGIVSARRTYMGKQWIQMSTPISPGNSGGPVFNGRGEVLGVATAIVGAIVAQNLNLAVPVNKLANMVKPDYPAKRKLGQSGGASHW